MTRSLISPFVAWPYGFRRIMAKALARACAMVWRKARQWADSGRRPVAHTDPIWEFHAEAAAPEGALYVNGELVGHVGVKRL
ncbi:MAG: hypothetical protein U5L74_03040 [Ideonella sp.]|nr:hypothetical protein [Ideonella sp.]